MIYIFNELSIARVNSIPEVRIILERFVLSVIRAGELGYTELRLHEKSLPNLFQLPLFEQYKIEHWLNDRLVPADLQIRFREIVTTFPIINETDALDFELYHTSQFYKKIEGQMHAAYGLGAAKLLDTVSVSLFTHSEWELSTLRLLHYSLDHTGNDRTMEVEVRHFSSPELLDEHKAELEKEQQEALVAGIDLWERRDDYFPSLLFGVDISEQVKTISSLSRIRRIFSCLKKLNDFAATWIEGGFSLNELRQQSVMDISNESPSTMQRFGVLRKFRQVNGDKVQFELHIKIPEIRIYFLPNETTHEITVGYIGKHLRTCSDK